MKGVRTALPGLINIRRLYAALDALKGLNTIERTLVKMALDQRRGRRKLRRKARKG